MTQTQTCISCSLMIGVQWMFTLPGATCIRPMPACHFSFQQINPFFGPGFAILIRSRKMPCEMCHPLVIVYDWVK